MQAGVCESLVTLFTFADGSQDGVRATQRVVTRDVGSGIGLVGLACNGSAGHEPISWADEPRRAGGQALNWLSAPHGICIVNFGTWEKAGLNSWGTLT